MMNHALHILGILFGLFLISLYKARKSKRRKHMKRFRIDYSNQVSNHTVVEANSEEEARAVFKQYKWQPEVVDHINSQEITDVTEEV